MIQYMGNIDYFFRKMHDLERSYNILHHIIVIRKSNIIIAIFHA